MQEELLDGILEVIDPQNVELETDAWLRIGEFIERLSDGSMRIEEGSLYPALYNLVKTVWIESELCVREIESARED